MIDSLFLRIRGMLKKSILLHLLYNKLLIFAKRAHNKNNIVLNKGGGHFSKDILGNNNVILIGQDAFLENTEIHIWGNNNQLEIQEGVRIGKNCSFYMEGNGINILIGRKTTFTQMCHFNAQENNTKIEVGEDCMFSNQVIVRTSDSHPIYSLETKQRLNPAGNVQIGKHVWVAPNSIIMKRAIIGDGCIIGSRTMVTGNIPPFSLAVGTPARVVKEAITWTREDLFA